MVATLAGIQRQLDRLRCGGSSGRTIYLFGDDPEPTDIRPTDTVVRFEDTIDAYD